MKKVQHIPVTGTATQLSFPGAHASSVHRLKHLSSQLTKVNHERTGTRVVSTMRCTGAWGSPVEYHRCGAEFPDVGDTCMFICTHGLSDLHVPDPSGALLHLLQNK